MRLVIQVKNWTTNTACRLSRENYREDWNLDENDVIHDSFRDWVERKEFYA